MPAGTSDSFETAVARHVGPADADLLHTAQTNVSVLAAIGFAHLLNDLIQSLLIAIYPLLKQGFSLSFAQIGTITLAYQLTASLLQPLVGFVGDKRPLPYALPVGMGFTLSGVVLLAQAQSFHALLLAASLVGLGSSVFHPESSRIARFASGGRHGFAQSLFQVGGNTGAALGPVLAAALIVPYGRTSLAWFGLLALVAIVLLWKIAGWYAGRRPSVPKSRTAQRHAPVSRGVAARTFAILGLLVFSKYFYIVSISSFLTFYLMQKHGLTIRSAQLHLFSFLAAVATGALIGGPLGDRIGRKPIIWLSILGAAPFALVLPYANLAWTSVLLVLIGLTLASAFSAMLVYAQELMPHRAGTVAGAFFGFAFGMAGISAAALGYCADRIGIEALYRICAFMPLAGVVAFLLPDINASGEIETTPSHRPAGASAETRKRNARGAVMNEPFPDIRIELFDPRWRADFERLNVAWLERYFAVEPVDREVLSNPEAHILAGGGHILFAVDEHGHAVGTVALRHEGNGVYELTKMAVDPACQGRGIGRALMDAALESYRVANGRQLLLESNSALAPALALYESVGFRRRSAPRPGSHYARADVFMVWEG